MTNHPAMPPGTYSVTSILGDDGQPIVLRWLTCEERLEALDPDALTTSPLPEGQQICLHRCEEWSDE